MNVNTYPSKNVPNLQVPKDHSPLKAYLVSLIKKDGAISFETFMQNALYHPEYGYYCKKEANFDYITSPMVHKTFGGIIASFLYETKKSVSKELFEVLEIGARDGLLSQSMSDYSTATGHKNIIYKAFDISPKESQLKTQVRPTEKLPQKRLGCVLSNELLDALPLTLFEVQQKEAYERLVDLNHEGNFVFVRSKDPSQDIGERVGESLNTLSDGYKGEVCFKFSSFAKTVDEVLDKGYVLTIDYGGTKKDIYNDKRKNGTLNCAYGHTDGWSPLVRVGNQDITAFVDFDEVDISLKKYGFKKLLLTTQCDFLSKLGFENWIDSVRRAPLPSGVRMAHLSAMRKLLDEHSFGGFKVMLHGRKVPDLFFNQIENPPLPQDYICD